ncbi:tripartite tricarboxylate transporter substrate binding protein BugE [soil metagenome]
MRTVVRTITLAALLVSHVAVAQSAWPTRQVRIIVPYAAGGTSDAAARLIAEKLKGSLGQTFIVEDKPGASGTTGMDALAKALPDGSTLAFSAISPLTLSPHLQRVPYDPLVDVIPAAQVMYSPVYLVATSAFTGKSFADVITHAKARPGQISVATSGTGSVGHVMLEQISRKAGVRFNHIPYKGGGQVVNDAAGAFFDLFTTNPSPSVNSLIAQGKLRVLAVAAPQRLPGFPDAPTFSELGHPDANLNSLFGIFAPAHTPPDVLARINESINRLLADPDVQSRLTNLDNIVSPASTDAFRTRVEREFSANAKVVKEAGIQAD